ncbi:MAG: DNA polymerase III subunit delta [Candidatus Hydrogenedentes bacterium]|nr:DNA polymerase III subunit delta [Candidatus Hydrogenedentota bacterium]
MDVQEFLQQAGKSGPAPVYLFCPGKPPRAREATFEPVLAQRATDLLLQLYVDPSMRDLCFNAYYADETDSAEIASVAQTFPFLAERRVVLVNNAEVYESDTHAAPIIHYLENPSESTVLIMVAAKLDRRKAFYKACEKRAVVVECPELREPEAKAWARREIEARSKSIDNAALDQLITRTGARLGDVNNAVLLVCNYVGDASAIRAADVTAACSDVSEEEIWTLTDAIAASDTNKAVHALRDIMDQGKSEFEVLGSINWLLKTAYMVTIPNGGRVKSSFLADKVRPLAEKLGREKFRDAFRLLMDTEIMFRSTGVDRALALELLVVKLAAPRRAPARA